VSILPEGWNWHTMCFNPGCCTSKDWPALAQRPWKASFGLVRRTLFLFAMMIQHVSPRVLPARGIDGRLVSAEWTVCGRSSIRVPAKTVLRITGVWE
jgi:hypothetical protein